MPLIALFIAAAGLVGAAVFFERAPTFSLAIGGALVAGLARFLAAGGPHFVPMWVAAWSLGGLVAGGAAGLWWKGGRPRGGRSKGAALVFAVLAPFASIALGLGLAQACPPYDNTQSPYCWWGDEDQLGGWVTDVAIIFFVELVLLAVLLLVSSRREVRR